MNQKDLSQLQTHRKNQYQQEQRHCIFQINSNFPSTNKVFVHFNKVFVQEHQGQQLCNHSTQQSNMLQQSHHRYFNMLEDVVAISSKQGTDSSDVFSCFGTTCAATTTARTILYDYRDGLDDSIEDSNETCRDFSLDNSGILISDSNIDDGNKMNYQENPCRELKSLREKIRKLEKENHQLKAQ